MYLYSVEPSRLISLIHRHTPFKVAEYRLLLEGWDNAVLLANGSHVFRFTRRPDVSEQLRKEVQLLPTLSKHLTLKVPVPEYTSSVSSFSPVPMLKPPKPLTSSHSKSHIKLLKKAQNNDSCD